MTNQNSGRPPRKTRRNGYVKAKPNVTIATIRPPRNRGSATKTSETRKRLLTEYERTFGNVSAACEFAGINRTTYYRWMESTTLVNRKFQKRIRAIRSGESIVDLAEATAIHLMAVEKNPQVTLHTLKTRGRSRGWADDVALVNREQNELETMLAGIRAMVDKKAKVNRISYIEQLRIYLELIGAQLKPEVRERLQKELAK